MKTLAFMQNQWFHDPARVEMMMERAKTKGTYWDYRTRIIKYALFAGCKSGRVLHSVFGEELCDRIHWEEASPKCGGHAASVFPADPVHMQAVIDLVEPERILVFGEIARQGIRGVKTSAGFIYGPHPAARQPDTIHKLKAMNAELVNSMNLKL